MSVQPRNPLIPNTAYKLSLKNNSIVFLVDSQGRITGGLVNNEAYSGTDIVDFLYFLRKDLQFLSGVVILKSGEQLPVLPYNRLMLKSWIVYIGTPKPVTYSYSEKIKLDPEKEFRKLNDLNIAYDNCYTEWSTYFLTTGKSPDYAHTEALKICQSVIKGTEKYASPPQPKLEIIEKEPSDVSNKSHTNESHRSEIRSRKSLLEHALESLSKR